MRSGFQTLFRLGIATFVLGFAFVPLDGQAQLSCSSSFEISQTFSNNAKWEMCWERRDREGIVLYDIHYTTEAGVRRKVLHQASIAQIHVPYDDDGARFHDVSDFGLGTSTRLNDLQSIDCPNGTLLSESSKNVICRQQFTDIDGSITGTSNRRAEALNVFSVSHVGAYNYIPEWTFFDDGTLDIAMGATGQLQRFGIDTSQGWLVNDSASPIGISHMHNYYWRLDFDIGDDASNDFVEEIEFVAEDSSNRTRAKSVTTFTTEAARSVNSQTKRFWRVKDTGIQNSEGNPISYEIVATDTGHRDIGPSFEPFTFNDVYVTNARECEKFASHNPADGPQGCVANEDVSDFVDGESLTGGDPIVWIGVTFHHIPRDEDEPYMPAHWNQFRMAPRDWTTGTVSTSNSPPVLTNPGSQSGNVDDVVSLQLVATDSDGHDITYDAIDLPSGLSINTATGLVSGTLAAENVYNVTAIATDSEGAPDSENFTWTVTRTNSPPSVVNPGTQSDEVGEFVNLQIVAIDDDGDTLTYAASGLPAGLSISSTTGLVNGQLTLVGLSSTTVFVSDPFLATTPVAFSWNVDAPTSNVPPIVTNPGNQESIVGNSVSLQIVAIDVNGDTLQYFATNLPDGLTIDQNSGVISGSPTTTESPTVTITVDDQQGGSVPINFDWDVSNGVLLNVGPLGRGLTGKDNATGSGYAMYTSERIQTRFASPPIDPLSADHIVVVRFDGSDWQYVTDNEYVDFTPRADDLLIASLDFSADSVNHLIGSDTVVNGLRAGYIDSDVIITANFWNGSPNAGEFGINGTFILANGGQPPPPNSAPVLTPPGSQSSQVDDVVALQLQATDDDGDTVTYGATGLPTGVSINTSTGLISGTTTNTGVFNVVATASDGNGGVDNESFTWTVSGSGGGTVLSVGPLGRGITGKDNATGTGYAMYTEERIQTRFTSPPIDPTSADNVVAVRYSSGNWQYITDNEFVNFTPRPTDLIVADLDFSADTVAMHEGTSSVVNGIEAGYASGDLVITPNMWNGSPNAGEFGISGTSIITN